jgi:hypothetical protein
MVTRADSCIGQVPREQRGGLALLLTMGITSSPDGQAPGWSKIRSCLNGGHPNGLDGFFRDYCRDVEHDVDRKARDTSWELHRVWTNHAVILGDELGEVCSRPVVAARPSLSSD